MEEIKTMEMLRDDLVHLFTSICAGRRENEEIVFTAEQMSEIFDNVVILGARFGFVFQFTPNEDNTVDVVVTQDI